LCPEPEEEKWKGKAEWTREKPKKNSRESYDEPELLYAPVIWKMGYNSEKSDTRE
jgi:hypothetical protein